MNTSPTPDQCKRLQAYVYPHHAWHEVMTTMNHTFTTWQEWGDAYEKARGEEWWEDFLTFATTKRGEPRMIRSYPMWFIENLLPNLASFPPLIEAAEEMENK